VRHLTDEIGARVTGSPGMKEANEWTRKQLADWGLQNAHLEAYAFGRGWSSSRALVQVLRPFEKTLPTLARPWAPGTDGGPVRGPLKIMTFTTEEDFAKYHGEIAGKVLLISEPKDLGKEEEVPPRRYSPGDLEELSRYDAPEVSERAYRKMMKLRLALARFALEEKALGFVDASSFGWGILRAGRGGSPKVDSPPGLPSVVISREEYNRLYRLVEAGKEVEVEMDVRARFHTEDLNAYNTVAEIPGTDPKGEIVLAGAHLDSYEAGTGATDNAAGCAVMMEAVRILKALGVKPRRTIRIGLWSGEEQGLYGSNAYVIDHLGSRPEPKDAEDDTPAYDRPASAGPFRTRPEHAKLSAYFNMDNGGGRIRGIYAQENAAAVPLFEAWLRPLRDLGATAVTMQTTDATDHIPFDAAGIPAFQFVQDELDYGTHTHHSNMDVFDHLDAADLKQASVVVATFLYQAAMRPERLPRKTLP
jgi:carboxypeptidase Q